MSLPGYHCKINAQPAHEKRGLPDLICRKLEGLPLGIELAAAQMEALAAEYIATRLGDAPRLLGRGNRTLPWQEPLRAPLDSSFAGGTPRHDEITFVTTGWI